MRTIVVPNPKLDWPLNDILRQQLPTCNRFLTDLDVLDAGARWLLLLVDPMCGQVVNVVRVSDGVNDLNDWCVILDWLSPMVRVSQQPPVGSMDDPLTGFVWVVVSALVMIRLIYGSF